MLYLCVCGCAVVGKNPGSKHPSRPISKLHRGYPIHIQMEICPVFLATRHAMHSAAYQRKVGFHFDYGYEWWPLLKTPTTRKLSIFQTLINRKDTNNLQNVGTAASKLLYTLHWTLLDAAEECADADREAGIVPREPFPYIFPLTCIQVVKMINYFLVVPWSLTFDSSRSTVCCLQIGSNGTRQEFVYLFAPLRHLLKEADLQNFRLENGLKIWPALWDYRHPNAQCFTAPVRPKKSNTTKKKTSTGAGIDGGSANPSGSAIHKESHTFNDIFIGMRKISDSSLVIFSVSIPTAVNLISTDHFHLNYIQDLLTGTVTLETPDHCWILT